MAERAPVGMIVVYGAIAGALIAALKLLEYRYLMADHAVEIYGGIVAALFAGLGIWLGLKLVRPKERIVVREIQVPAKPFVLNTLKQDAMGITKRELEILEHIAAGLSTREIAGKLFVSENTVKTHTARLLDKLNARRRTQAVQLAKEAGLIP